MSDEKQATQEGEGAAAPAKAGPPMMLMIGVVAGALVLGGAVGGFVLGPRFVPTSTSPAAHGDDAHGEEDAGGHGGGKGHGKGSHGGRTSIYQIENIIVNPSDSRGTRFLMTTVAFQLPDDKLASALRDRDVEVRDKVIAVLESKTLIELTRPGARQEIKQELEAAVKPLAGGARYVRVYLPQFVIQ